MTACVTAVTVETMMGRCGGECSDSLCDSCDSLTAETRRRIEENAVPESEGRDESPPDNQSSELEAK